MIGQSVDELKILFGVVTSLQIWKCDEIEWGRPIPVYPSKVKNIIVCEILNIYRTTVVILW